MAYDFNIKKPIDVKLNVQPVMYGLYHEYVFEGPCRFGAGDELLKDADMMKIKESKKALYESLRDACDPKLINVLEPTEILRDETFPLTEQHLIDAAGPNPDDVDMYIFGNFGFGIDFLLEFVRKYNKPVAYMEFCCGNTSATAALWARGYEAYVFETPQDAANTLRIMRARKALAKTKVLGVTRGCATVNGSISLSTQDSFLNLDDVTKRLGTKFRYIDVHEFLDQSANIPDDTNPTLPGRHALNITDEDQKAIDKAADELINGAVYNNMKREDVEPSVRANYLVQKLLEHYDCNAFAAPCPDMCATRRLNENRFTLCLNHALNNEEGICSACEYDISALLSMELLCNLSFSAPYMGNTAVATYGKGEPVPPLVPLITMQDEHEETQKSVEGLENICYTFHATPPRKLKGFDAKQGEYGLNSFAYSGWGATIRYDFSKDNGQVMTMCRFDPLCRKIFVCKATVAGGMGYKAMNCSEGVFFQVENSHKFLQCAGQVGNHIPLVYGDYVDDVIKLAKMLDLEVITL